MALVRSENFNGGADGVAATTGNTNADLFSGGGTSVFETTDAVEGSAALRVACTASTRILEFDITSATTVWFGFYVYPITYPSGLVAICNWWGTGGTGKVGDVRMSTTGTLQLRDNSSNVDVASHALTQNQWHRVAVRSIPGSGTGHRLKVYSGANLHTTTATYDSGDEAATSGAQTQVDNIRIGLISSITGELMFDRFRVDNANETDAITVPVLAGDLIIDRS